MKFTFKLYIKEKDAPKNVKAKLHTTGKIEAPSVADAKANVKDVVRIPYGYEIADVLVTLIKNPKNE